MNKKSYADQCLERAEKATEGPWEYKDDKVVTVEKDDKERTYGYGCENDFVVDLNDNEYHSYIDKNEQNSVGEFIAHARTDVPELARRLKRACEALRSQPGQYDIPVFEDLLKELEKPLEKRKNEPQRETCGRCGKVLRTG